MRKERNTKAGWPWNIDQWSFLPKIYSLRALYLLTPDELEWISPYILCYITLHLLPTYCILYRRAPFKRRDKSLGACTQGMFGWKLTLGWSWLGLAVGIARRPNKGLAGRLRITEFSQSGLFLTRVINKRNTYNWSTIGGRARETGQK